MNVPEHATRPVVMELFSSQGCGNCPAANANLAKLAERSDVIAITYPVGIWDYLGWGDTFAKPEFTERQKRYNRVLGYRGPYTPQVVYSGRVHGPGTSIPKIETKFATRDITPYPATVTFDKDAVVISGSIPAPPTPAAATTTDKPALYVASSNKATIVVVRYKPGLTKVTPGAGVNKGKSMTYFNLVTSFEPIGEWGGGIQQKFQAHCTSGCVVLVQAGGTEGPIIGAAQR